LYTTAFQRRAECLSHETFADILELPLSAVTDSAADLLDAVRSHAGDNGELQLRLDRDLVISLDCPSCKSVREVFRPASAVGIGRAECEQCGQILKPNLVNQIERGSTLARESLSRLGVPKFDVVRVATRSREWHVLLAGDRNSMYM
jgi:hypothetical protein